MLALPSYASSQPPVWDALRAHPALKLSKRDMITYDHFFRVYKIADKGYASPYILDKAIKESTKDPRWSLFNEWLKDLRRFPSLPISDLAQACLALKARLPSEVGFPRLLVSQRLNSCRQVALQQMAPKILADDKLGSDEHNFLTKNMRAFLSGKGREDFLWFLKQLSPRPTPHADVSSLVTAYVVKHNRQLHKDFLPVLVITPELTQHIQKFGLDEGATRQIFQTEYSRLIEEAYSAIESKDAEASTKRAKALGRWLRLNLDKLPSDAALGRYGDLGKNLWRNGHEDAAIEVFDLVMRDGSPDLRDDARFYRIWIWINRGQWKEARKWIEGHALHRRFHEIKDSRLKYWIARVYQQTESGKDARGMWEKTLQEHPLGFYAIMAQKSLKAHHPSSPSADYYAVAARPSPPTLTVDELSNPEIAEPLRRLRAWARLDQREFMEAELRGLRRGIIPTFASAFPPHRRVGAESDAWIVAADVVGQEGNFLESFRVIYGALDRKKAVFSRPILEALYPRPYFDQLQKVMKDKSVDPLLVLSLIRQESVFNPQARSRVGARGLMQLMPQTARRFRRGVRDQHLVAPATNLEIGTRYFLQLHKRYEGNLVHVLAAYNAGEARVHRWRGTYLKSEEMLPSIENIPFLETRNYVKLIFRNLFFYKILEDPTSADPPELNKIHDVALGFKR